MLNEAKLFVIWYAIIINDPEYLTNVTSYEKMY